MAHRRAARARHRDGLGPRRGRLRGRHLSGLDDRRAVRLGVPPWFMVAHSRGESFAEVVDVRGEPASTPTARPAPCTGPSGRSLPWPRLVEPRAARDHPAGGTPQRRDQRLASRHDLHRSPQGADPARRPRGVEPAPEPVDRDLRLRERRAGRVRSRRLSPRGPRGRGRSFLRDPRLLPPGHYRGTPLRRRRRALGVQPRPARG